MVKNITEKEIQWWFSKVSSMKGNTFNILVCSVVFNATNSISVVSWRSVLLVDKIGGPGENHRPVASYWQTWSHNVVHLAWSRFVLATSVLIGTDCIGSCKSNYHTITATTTPTTFNKNLPEDRELKNNCQLLIRLMIVVKCRI